MCTGPARRTLDVLSQRISRSQSKHPTQDHANCALISDAQLLIDNIARLEGLTDPQWLNISITKRHHFLVKVVLILSLIISSNNRPGSTRYNVSRHTLVWYSTYYRLRSARQNEFIRSVVCFFLLLNDLISLYYFFLLMACPLDSSFPMVGTGLNANRCAYTDYTCYGVLPVCSKQTSRSSFIPCIRHPLPVLHLYFARCRFYDRARPLHVWELLLIIVVCLSSSLSCWYLVAMACCLRPGGVD